ncbi:hyccin-like isoform X2 [Stegodyphus dumicola]|uniref:hyccin-like isoform X2 n=1 Tax=Stegodyphus dumicola TaxID=202533 RepID=UPI0015AB168D|nr:hyccin-like isoform X2 [Stegodyphus dumicola]XP_035227722.1 hyccin-like isoform X2 [Stegodyphus dumicola]
MAEAIVREWIADYKFLEPVCHQFFSFYRSREENLQNFARQYIPCLIGLYLSSVAKGNRKNVRCVEVVLLGIYNLEVTDSSGKSACVSFRIPLLSKPSIYHEPMSLSHTVLSERALSTLEYADSRMVTIGPYPEVEKINASNRLMVMTVLMWLYNQYIGNMSTFSHMSVCKMCSRIVKQGFNRANRPNYGSECSSGYNNPHPRPIARIPVSSSLLLEMIHAVYFATFNGLASIGLQSLDELHSRAMHEMLSDVLLVTNAIRNSLKVNPSGQPCDGPMGISVALSPTAVVSTVSRAITNASFRAKKLPDDIPIQENESGETHQLSSINEECEEGENQPANHRNRKQGSNNSSFASAITKVGVLQLRKGKDKKKDKEAVNGDTVDYNKGNGKINETSSVSNDEDRVEVCFSNTDQMSLHNSYSCRTDLPKSPVGNSIPNADNFDFKDTLNNAKYVNHSNQGSEVVITNDGTCILKSILHKSESANGLQNSSLQTAV